MAAALTDSGTITGACTGIILLRVRPSASPSSTGSPEASMPITNRASPLASDAAAPHAQQTLRPYAGIGEKFAANFICGMNLML